MHCRSTAHLRRAIQALVVGVVSLTFAVPAAQASNIAQTRALIEKLTSQLHSEIVRSDSLDQQYLEANVRLTMLNISIDALRQKASSQQVALDKTTRKLGKAVVRAYIDGSIANQSIPYFDVNVNNLDATKVYEHQVDNILHNLEVSQISQENALHRTLGRESAQLSQVVVESRRAHSLFVQNNIAVARSNQLLQVMHRTLTTKIIGYEIYFAVYAAKHHNPAGVVHAWQIALEVGGSAAGNQVIEAAARVTARHNIKGTAAGTRSGLVAVAAAESQIGVPYVWGGESPGVGFDCSGLVQWAWGRAGYSIQRTTETQWASMRHVPLSQLRPGDLLFYYNLDGDHLIDHEVMYVGSGPWGTNTVIAAAYTGTNISLGPLFTDGLYGAARP